MPEKHNFISRYLLQRFVCELLPDSRVHVCRRWKVPKSSTKILYNDEYKRALYGGLMTCGLNWLCPVCGSKIAERRSNDLANGLNNHFGDVTMYTLTMRHKREDKLKDNIDIITAAYRQLTHGEWWMRFKDDYGLVGMVSNLEVKWGFESGWHPHKHLLFLWQYHYDDSVMMKITKKLQDRFHQCVINYGGSGLATIECFQSERKATRAEIIAWYVSKYNDFPKTRVFGVEDELTRIHTKDRGHYSYWQLLEMWGNTILADENGEINPEKRLYRDLIREYALATKGERTIRFSPYVRDLMGANAALTDLEIASETREKARLLIALSDELWFKIVSKELRGEVLQAANDNPDGIKEYIRELNIKLLGKDSEDGSL